ncbi:PTSINtr with GAF domain, PtsP [Desulfuromusa kysingii]|uniref:phosphoenolpyruvate--protein phosphotransferase n=1 Tax=Desulfuromusa kysingii TaxID=37625 RepID=A0A1H3YJT2_9BACT|nr:phosphoenolpyruvate--protein phosphotransferase [Desulfuromusa kysingii]SEA11461.1 PTSINtr with GAF domain, PtsP [Desulfuromusa kysingii]
MTSIKRTKSDRNLGLSTLQDISALILQSHDLDETIRNIVDLVALRAHSDVCSLYLLENDQETLTLRATKGLDESTIGRVSMKIGEGLTGKVAADKQILAIEEPHKHPDYQYFAETGEEQFHTFVGIPLFDHNHAIGVLVVQTREHHIFSKEELATLSTIAFQVASIVVNARLLDAIDHYGRKDTATPTTEDDTEDSESQQSNTLRGKAAYPGVVTGPANIIDQQFGFSDIFDECNIDLPAELKRLDEALRKTRIQTLYLEKRVAEKLTQEDAAIFHTHLMILEDRGFIDRLHILIEEQHSAPYALKKVISGYLEAFGQMEDPYLRERAADMEDIGRRLLANLVGKNTEGLQLHHSGILVAKRLLPSDMAILDHRMIMGMVIESNEANSHSVIMAKALGIPAVIGVKSAISKIKPDDNLILDANSGCIYQNPDQSIIDEYSRLGQEGQLEKQRLLELQNIPPVTRNGQRIHLRANIGLISDVNVAKTHGAEGVGLYRTEFPYMARSSFPDRQDQYLLYKKVVKDFAGTPVTIRTLDIGGDKALPYFTQPKEDNPFMGWRSVRVSLDNLDIFQTQIEAILMAAKHGPIRLLFPMISNMEEIRTCKIIVEKAKDNLRKEKILFAEDIPLGAMIEVPAAVRLASHLAKEVDFFALGTNDLIQYLLAADRSNPLVEKYYDPLHPAVLLSIGCVVAAAHNNNIELCACGEMATDPACLLALIGLGIHEFSLSAPYIPRLKNFINRIDTVAAEELLQSLLLQADSHSIREALDQAIRNLPVTDFSVIKYQPQPLQIKSRGNATRLQS